MTAFPIQLSEHDPKWADWYEEESGGLVTAFGDFIVCIDHIGSTFVEGLIAKPIVDIPLQLKPDADLAVAKELLAIEGWLLVAEDSDFGDSPCHN